MARSIPGRYGAIPCSYFSLDLSFQDYPVSVFSATFSSLADSYLILIPKQGTRRFKNQYQSNR
jgi:hypothetical protein